MPTSRRSRDTDRALRLARRHSPQTILLTVECMRDPTASWSDRLKAVHIVLQVGLPKDPDAIAKALGEYRGH